MTGEHVHVITSPAEITKAFSKFFSTFVGIAILLLISL